MNRRPAGTAERQAHLLAAAIEVVGESGMRGLTHRAVDRRAELPEGTCSVYFRTRLALLTALAEHVADRLAADVDALASRLRECPADAEDQAERQTVDLLVGWSREPALLATIAEVTLEAVRTPSLVEQVRRWRDRLTAIVTGIAQDAGTPDGALRAECIVAALEGVVMASLAYPDDSRGGFIRRTTPLVISGIKHAGAPSAN